MKTTAIYCTEIALHNPKTGVFSRGHLGAEEFVPVDVIFDADAYRKIVRRDRLPKEEIKAIVKEVASTGQKSGEDGFEYTSPASKGAKGKKKKGGKNVQVDAGILGTYLEKPKKESEEGDTWAAVNKKQ